MATKYQKQGWEKLVKARAAFERALSNARLSVVLYDESGDHLKHAPGDDCVRCKLKSAIEAASEIMTGESAFTNGSKR